MIITKQDKHQNKTHDHDIWQYEYSLFQILKRKQTNQQKKQKQQTHNHGKADRFSHSTPNGLFAFSNANGILKFCGLIPFGGLNL